MKANGHLETKDWAIDSWEQKVYSGKVVIRISKRRLITAILVFVYPILLLTVLKEFVAPTFDYMGYRYTVPEERWYAALSVSFSIIPGLFLPLTGRKPGNLLVWIIYVIAYVPIQFIPVFSIGLTPDQYLPMQLAVLGSMILLTASTAVPAIRLPHLNLPPIVFLGGISLLSIVTYGLAIYSYGIPTSLPSLVDVYDVRADYKAEFDDLLPGVAYLLNWQQRIVNPFLIAYGMVSKRAAPLLLGIGGQLFLFGINGQKSVVFSGLMILAVLFVAQKSGKFLAPLVMLGVTMMTLSAMVIDSILGNPLLSSMFIRRMVFTPGLLTGYYFEFFTQNQFVELSQSILSSVKQYPYQLGVPQLIGSGYFGNPQMSANANIWADGFANFGLYGVVGVTLLLCSSIWIFNSLAIGRSLMITSALAGMIAWAFTDSAFFTVLNTHGMLLSFAILVALPANLGSERIN